MGCHLLHLEVQQWLLKQHLAMQQQCGRRQPTWQRCSEPQRLLLRPGTAAAQRQRTCRAGGLWRVRECPRLCRQKSPAAQQAVLMLEACWKPAPAQAAAEAPAVKYGRPKPRSKACTCGTQGSRQKAARHTHKNTAFPCTEIVISPVGAIACKPKREGCGDNTLNIPRIERR